MIVMPIAFGRPYIDCFFDRCLPSLMTPNNFRWCRVVGGNSLAALSEQMIVGRVRRRGQAWQVGLAEPRAPIH
jgi:hypothetical protein